MNSSRIEFLTKKESTLKIQKWWKNVYYEHYYTCPVCFKKKNEFNVDIVSPYNCSHKFCKTCVDSWSTHGGSTCPCCRSRSNEIVSNNQNRNINELSEVLYNYLSELISNYNNNYINQNNYNYNNTDYNNNYSNNIGGNYIIPNYVNSNINNYFNQTNIDIFSTNNYSYSNRLNRI